MKTAILISGQMRTADVCNENAWKHVAKRVPFTGRETFIHAAADEDAHKLKLYGPKRAVVEEQPQLDEKNYGQLIGLGCYGVQVVLRQLWALQRVWQIMEGDGYRPDWVIRLRPDCWFHNDMEDPMDCDQNCLYVPTFHNFFGLNDRFAFGSYEVMKVYMNRLDNMDEFVTARKLFHPETHLKWTMERAGIEVRRTNILFDLVRKNGQHVKPQWNHDCDYGDVTKCS
jgi:hypothetical protein